MKVHHLNCGTMHLLGTHLVCHVLLVETDGGLVLVDSGYGLTDVADPAHRLGPYRHIAKADLNPAEAAVRQIERLGFRCNDIRHIVLTHLDVDHIGGVTDFPEAHVHVSRAETDAVRGPRTVADRARYRHARWVLDSRLVVHEPVGESWETFHQAHELTDVAPGIVMISTPGHSRGHTAIAVDAGHRWVLHAGDAAYLRSSLDGSGRRSPIPIRVQERFVAHDITQLREDRQRLADLYQQGDPTRLVVTAHDPDLLERAQAK
ncbi:MAG: MBL fold metallo-hydrolase [Mycobacterium sp.]